VTRILTTHVGSLPRPQSVVDKVFAEDRAIRSTTANTTAPCSRPCADQVAACVDIVSDGEMSNASTDEY
jgi:5-methyltetrahydropteroyltriglutamate--homocysteine methyltransferase